MDRMLSTTLFVLALACACTAALLALSGFIDYLVQGRWPDQSVLRIGYDSGLLEARWFLRNDWSMPVRDVLARVPAALASLVLTPLLWWLSNRFASR